MMNSFNVVAVLATKSNVAFDEVERSLTLLLMWTGL